jgi:leucyl aminopeptidase
MKIMVQQGSAQSFPTEALVVNLFEGVGSPGGATGAVDRAMNGRISALIASGDIRGKLGEVTVLYPEGGVAAKRVIVVGLGKQEEFGLEAVRHAAGAAAQKIRSLGLTSFATVVHGSGAGGIAPEDAAQALVEGSILSLYTFTRHKTVVEEPTTPIEEMVLIEFDAGKIPAMQAGARAGQIIADGVSFVRDLVNEPANITTPAALAGKAQAMARDLGLRCQVLEREDMQSLGMGALLGVSQGSEEPPKLIILEYQPDAGLPTIALVGKALTFDSGGISLKPSEDMHKMKGDMAGGAAVMGVLWAAAMLRLPFHLVGIIPATENMPSGKALKPGDIVTSLSGKTIEVQNTDAEGRLVLADALTYAGRFQPAAIVDLATLTGACVVALGNITTGLMSTDDRLASQLEAAGQRSGERVWRLPLFKEYGEQLKSDVADLCNVGGRPAGAITAAYFLSQFVGDFPWAHLDIAGTYWTDKPAKPYQSKGATGVGVRLLMDWLRRWEGA